jgi:hypothetical protein
MTVICPFQTKVTALLIWTLENMQKGILISSVICLKCWCLLGDLYLLRCWSSVKFIYIQIYC